MNPNQALTQLPPQALAAFADEQARIASIRALMDAILGTEAELKTKFNVNVARIVMVGQILQVQKQSIAYGRIGDWFVTHFGKERMKTMSRWASVGEAMQQRCPELAQRTGQMLLDHQTSAEELAEVGSTIAEQTGVDTFNRLYQWAATVRNPAQPKRERAPAPLSPEKKAAKELADFGAHIADLKEILHVLGTAKARSMWGRLAEENGKGFVNLREALSDQWSVVAAHLKSVKVK